MKSIRHRMSAWVLCFAVGTSTLAPSPSLAAQQSAGAEAGLGVASVITTLFYGTAKIVYAGLGALTGGFAFVLSGGNADLSRVLLDRSLRGDYVITPEVLTGEKDLVFVGPDSVDSGDEATSQASAPDQSEPYPY